MNIKKKLLKNDFIVILKAVNHQYMIKRGIGGVSKKHTPTHIAAVFKISPEGIFREPFQLFQCLQGSITHDI
ncbi:hypothetical protein CL3_21960 [butyrate-producing bacterium SM4/1]|nr:hypothetical protein CL3_21960 [butyrate-producing bacterium SM4/1]